MMKNNLYNHLKISHKFFIQQNKIYVDIEKKKLEKNFPKLTEDNPEEDYKTKKIIHEDLNSYLKYNLKNKLYFIIAYIKFMITCYNDYQINKKVKL